MTHLLSVAASAPDVPAAGLGEKLDWDAFSARYFPGQRRHDLDAVAAYGAYKQDRDRQSGGHQTRPKLTLVPNESPPAAIEAESDETAVERLLVAVSSASAMLG